jgi:hypothetical protein
VTAGPYTLEPSRKDWRRRRAYWRVRLAGEIVVPYRQTPRIALLEAVRREVNANA